MKYVEIDGVEYEVLPALERIKKMLVGNPVFRCLLPKVVVLRILRASGSPLIEESMVRPGGWRAMEIIYENKEPRNFIDRMAVRNGAFPMAIRNRKKMVNKLLRGLFDRHSGEERITVVSVGSGPGTHVIDAMADHDHDEIHAHCIDLDSDAFEFGRMHKEEHGLSHRVCYIEGDARSVREHVSVPPHIVKMIGLLEYLNDEECVEMFRVMYGALRPGGTLITHGLVDSHGMDWFLKKAFDWDVVYRTGDHVVRLLREALFDHFEVNTEPMGIYPIVAAKK